MQRTDDLHKPCIACEDTVSRFVPHTLIRTSDSLNNSDMVSRHFEKLTIIGQLMLLMTLSFRSYTSPTKSRAVCLPVMMYDCRWNIHCLYNYLLLCSICALVSGFLRAFAADFSSARRSLAAFISFGAEVRTCLIWVGTSWVVGVMVASHDAVKVGTDSNMDVNKDN